VGAHAQGVAGAVVEPGDDLDIDARSPVGAGESVVGEVGLPGLVGSLALASGASLPTTSRLLGHVKVSTTADVYSHMLPDDFDALAAAMDRDARAAELPEITGS
jgi:hypothetical protein